MTRREAVDAICEVIDSGILYKELEDKLIDVCDCICDDDFTECEPEIPCDFECEDCKFLQR